MAVPVKPSVTVTSWLEIPESAAVTVAVPPFSANGLPLRPSPTLGWPVLSVMVAVT